MATSGQHNFTPRQVLEKFYEAERIFTSAPPEQRTFDPIAAVLADDFQMEQSSALPWAGTYHGPQGFRDWLERASEWTSIDVRDSEIYENADSDKVVVLSRIYNSSRKTGEKVDFPLSQTFTIDREKGQIREIRSFYWDIRRLNEVIGYSG